MYVSELRSLARFCKFGSSLENMLRDRIVCGINDDTIQKRLLAEAKLTYVRALELAQGVETAARNVKEISCKETASPYTPTRNGQQEVYKVTPERQAELSCYRCGKAGHVASNCRFKGAKCHKCGKTRHLQRVCRSKPKDGGKRNSRSVNRVEEEEEYCLLQLRSLQSTPPLKVMLKLEDCPVEMEIDTGAALSLVSEATFEKLWKKKPALAPSQVRLRSYSGEPIPVVGSVEVNVVYKQQSAKLPLLVVHEDGLSLLGRNWLSQLKLDWQEIHHLSTTPLHTLLDKYDSVFQEGLGTLKDFKARIYVDPEAKPRYCKARSVPYAMRQMIEGELARLVEEGTLEPVQFASLVAPIVSVLKADKLSVRICGDFHQTVNPVSKLD